jgi:hypothetical protein
MESVHLHSVSEHFQLELVPPQKIFRSSNAAFYLRPSQQKKRVFYDDARPASNLCNLPKTPLSRTQASDACRAT